MCAMAMNSSVRCNVRTKERIQPDPLFVMPRSLST